MTEDITIHHVALDATTYAQVLAYARSCDLTVSDVVVAAWRLYRAMAAIQEEPLLQHCSYCGGMHLRGTVEDCPMKAK